MTTPPPADPPAPPAPPADPPAPPAPPADPPAPPAPDDDVIKDRAELARLRAENAELKKPKPPAPPKKTAPPVPPADPPVPVKRRRSTSRLLGDNFYDD